MSNSLKSKRQVLIRGDSKILCVVLDPEKITPCGEYIRLGEYHSDEISGYYPLQEVLEKQLTVLKEFSE